MLNVASIFQPVLAAGTVLTLALGATGVVIQQAFQDVDQIAERTVASHTQAAALMYALDTGRHTADERELAAAGYLDLEARDAAFAEGHLIANDSAQGAQTAATQTGK